MHFYDLTDIFQGGKLMTHDPLFQEKIRLGDELDNSIKQIIYGLKELQIALKETSYYFITFQLLASGIERLLKCSICYGKLHKQNRFPVVEELKTHKIDNLLKLFIQDYYDSSSCPAFNDDYEFLTQDSFLQELIKSLSVFGDYARYYNLNVVTGAPKKINIEEVWDDLQKDFIASRPDLMKKLFDEPDYKTVENEISKYFVSCFEKLVRAITRQFTLGDMGEEPKRHLGTYVHFVTLSDDKIGATDYFEKFFKKEIRKPMDYTSSDGIRSNVITKKEYSGQWPFRNVDSVTIQKRANNCVTIVVDDKVYALNGLAIQILNLPDPFEANIAYKGRSLHYFISAALAL